MQLRHTAQEGQANIKTLREKVVSNKKSFTTMASSSEYARSDIVNETLIRRALNNGQEDGQVELLSMEVSKGGPVKVGDVLNSMVWLFSKQHGAILEKFHT